MHPLLATRPGLKAGATLGACVALTLAAFAASPSLWRHLVDYGNRLETLRAAPETTFERVAKPEVGFDTLPGIAQVIARELRARGIGEYWATPELQGTGQLWQRIVEASWPSRPRETAKAIIRRPAPPTPDCRVFALPGTGFELAACGR